MSANRSCWIEKEYSPWDDQKRKLVGFMDQAKKDVGLVKSQLIKKEGSITDLIKKLEQTLVAKGVIEKDLEDVKSQLMLLENYKTSLETQTKDLNGFELQAREYNKEVEALKAMLEKWESDIGVMTFEQF